MNLNNMSPNELIKMVDTSSNPTGLELAMVNSLIRAEREIARLESILDDIAYRVEY